MELTVMVSSARDGVAAGGEEESSDWNVVPLGECLLESPSYGINAPAVPYTGELPTYIRITDIDDEGRFSPEPRVSVRHPDADRFFLSEGDLVFARTGASVGKSYRYRPEDGPLVYAGFLIRVAPDPTKLLPEYLAYYAQTKQYWDWVASVSVRTGQPGINASQYADLPVPLPPVDDQRAIAEALQDADALVRQISNLVAKKRHLKLAAQQELLTGATRLPGFTEPWHTTSLGSIGSFSKGRGIRRKDITDQGVPCVRYGELYTQYDNYIPRATSRVPPSVAEGALPISRGDILFTGSGETAEEIGKCAAYTGEQRAVAGGDIVVLHATDHNPVFLGHLLNSESVAKQKARLGQGNAVVHIHPRQLAQVEVSLPRLEEQQAIAKILLDMDAEITALEDERDKMAAIRKGMIQELLNGRARPDSFTAHLAIAT